MAVALSTDADRKGWLEIDLTGAASTDNAGLGEIANPEGCTLAVTRVFAYFATGSTGAANLDVGIGASGAKASDICSAMAVADVTVGGKVLYLPAAQAAETENPTALWTSSTYMTFTGSATTAGLSAKLYVEYIRL